MAKPTLSNAETRLINSLGIIMPTPALIATLQKLDAVRTDCLSDDDTAEVWADFPVEPIMRILAIQLGEKWNGGEKEILNAMNRPA